MMGQALLNGNIIFPHVEGLELREDATLPGHGDPGANCGFPLAMHCNHCGAHWVGETSCMKRECPNCFRKWANKEARAAAGRAWAGSILRVGWRRRFRLLHVVISFKDDGNADLPTLRKNTISILKKHGISGGLLIWHPFRKDGDNAFVPDGYVHFHTVGLARGNVMPPAKGQGYVFKVIPNPVTGDYRGFKKVSHIRQCVFYLLTHCGILRGRHTLTWYGELSYNMLSTRRLEEYCPELMAERPARMCPVCKSEDIEPDIIFDWTGGSPVSVYWNGG